ncbi:hypothetical protein DFH09DRAFT_1071400 [Mycena vulgaris]|nr:hypothetical protein DFH09DRAFT_1071400 [Mycena vulgaris]
MEIAPTVRDGVDSDAPTPDQAQTTPMNMESSQEPSKAAGGEANMANDTGVAKDKAEVGHAKNASKAADTVFEQDKVENTEDQKEADEKKAEIGFDTELTDRRPTPEEERIEECIPKGALRKTVILGWQIVELHATDMFPVVWNNIGVRLIQLAQDDSVWVLDMWKIRAMPTELVRILTATKIEKTGGGLTRDITLIWDDLHIEMRNLVDLGMMMKLLFSEKPVWKKCSGTSCPRTSAPAGSNWKAATLEDTQIDSNWESRREQTWWDGAEVAWWTSDWTWYGQGKFIGYP